MYDAVKVNSGLSGDHKMLEKTETWAIGHEELYTGSGNQPKRVYVLV